MRRALLFSVCLLAACGRENPGAPRLPAAASAERPYRPPADGRLREPQLQAYVSALRAGARSAGEPRGVEPEGDALRRPSAREEDLWIRQKVLEAEMRLDERSARRREIEVDRKTADALRKSAAASTDPATRDALGRQAADLDRRAADVERALRRPRDAAEEENDSLVSRYRRQIAAAQRRSP